MEVLINFFTEIRENVYAKAMSSYLISFAVSVKALL